ncbi:MAG: ABC transporter permease [Actinobacteria bacterium]|nr:MAG: ABC transporter permease [Actinomycetota bacterium]
MGLPLAVMFVLGGVFGNTPSTEEVVYRGVGAMDYYLPAYLALLLASMAVVALPVHIASYRERGVIRLFQASSVPLRAVIGSQFMVTLVIAVAGSILLIAVGMPVYGVRFPASVPLLIAGFLLGVLEFAAIGILLGIAFRTSRAAQGAGIMLWFVLMMVGGAGPPPEVLPAALRGVGAATPIKPAIFLLQDAWLGFGWNWTQTLLVLAFTAGAFLLILLFMQRRLFGER